jgi:adenylate cyclase
VKRCPQCNRVETDDTLVYCRADGSPLAEASGEVETSLLPNAITNHSRVRSTGPTTVLPTSDAQSSTRQLETAPRRQHVASTRNSVIAGAIGILVVTALGVGSYLKYGRSDKQINSIAVMPFENKSGNADSEYLSDGLAESLIYRLSQLPNLEVSPRSSVFRYKGQAIDAEKVGNDLGVDAVMSGRLIQRGDDLMISVDLIDVRNKKTLWGEQFQRKMSDLLTTQSEIASTIADKLQLRLSGNDTKGISKPYTNNNEAYQLYLQGRYFWNKRSSGNLKKATELLKAATEKDPNFALAYAGLADCYVVSYYYIGEKPRDLMPLAKTFAAKAIQLDPTLAEPHATLGFASWLLDWDKVAAEKELRRAIELNPNYPTAHHWYSRFLRGVGRPDEAFREIKRAEELDPLSLVIINNVAENHIDRGDLDAATRESQRLIDLEPSFWPGHQTLAIVLVKQGRYAEALTEVQKSVEFANRSNAPLALLGHVYARMGRQSEAEAVIKELEKRFAAKQADGRDLAVVYAGLEDKNKAFEWLEKSFKERGVFLVFLKLEPLLQPLHSDPRWGDLERRVGIS